MAPCHDLLAVIYLCKYLGSLSGLLALPSLRMRHWHPLASHISAFNVRSHSNGCISNWYFLRLFQTCSSSWSRWTSLLKSRSYFILGWLCRVRRRRLGTLLLIIGSCVVLHVAISYMIKLFQNYELTPNLSVYINQIIASYIKQL